MITGDIWLSQLEGGYGTSRVEARDAAQYPAADRTAATQGTVDPKTNRAKAQKPCPKATRDPKLRSQLHSQPSPGPHHAHFCAGGPVQSACPSDETSYPSPLLPGTLFPGYLCRLPLTSCRSLLKGHLLSLSWLPHPFPHP